MRVLYFNANNELVAADVSVVTAASSNGNTCFTFNHNGRTYTAISLTSIDPVIFLSQEVISFTSNFKMCVETEYDVEPQVLTSIPEERIIGLDPDRHRIVIAGSGSTGSAILGICPVKSRFKI